MANERVPARAVKMWISPFKEVAMENAVYWQGRQVGIECAGRIGWFSSAPQEAIAAYSAPESKRVAVAGEDGVVARNLTMTSGYERFDRS